MTVLPAKRYLYAVDTAQRTQKQFLGRLVRYADDFVLQCGTAAQAARALTGAQAQLQPLGLRLHPGKTRGVNDREGFDFLGFHPRRKRTWRGRETGACCGGRAPRRGGGSGTGSGR